MQQYSSTNTNNKTNCSNNLAMYSEYQLSGFEKYNDEGEEDTLRRNKTAREGQGTATPSEAS
jgi:hypothetical protein